ncbi:mechanosensitive ion channel family protein [Demequina zhanjiangensis]|uniref:Mechanosensitive ion channel family protein n=1 Tax=Demequina zhanjiangensis TaxID=3051659 RepID=A0ABT8G1G0_9MICO|nr:mechanosensitive ion channel family protein [Demequina sp. SYSU T00b26]MDN4472970.1 mechanosensitive ion channel family protein [Demequina sp. SYSU T00b26]
MLISGMSSLASTATAASVDPTPNPSPSLPGSGQVNRLSEYFDDIFGSGFGPLAFIGVIILVAIILWSIGRWVIKVVTQSIEDGLPVTERRARAALKKARISVAEDTLDSRLERERRRQRAKTIRLVLNSTWAVLIITTTVLIVLGEVGISIAPLLASAGIVGVALGFGAQSLVKDLIAGVFMLVEDQYGVGDIIDVGEASGVVEEIGLRSVRLRSIDGTMWYVPNGNITRVGNMTRLWSRAMLEVKIGYDSDVEEARQAMLDAVEAARSQDEQVDGSILSEPDVPGIESFDYDSVTLRLLIQVQPATQWDVMRALRREIRREFADRGIQMALPHQGFKLDRPSPDTLREHTAETHADPASHPGKGETTRGGSVVRGDQGAEGDE